VKKVLYTKDPLSNIGKKNIYLLQPRPIIAAYAVGVLCQFMHDPQERHKQAKDNLQCLKSSLGKELFKKKDTLTLKIYSDTDYKALLPKESTIYFLEKVY